MRESEYLNPPERELAEALQSLQLAPLQTSPLWIWYQAGLHTSRQRANGWRAIAATAMLVAALIFVWGRQTHSPVERLVYVRQESAPAAAVAAPADSVSTTSLSADYLRLCDETIREGLEGPSPERAGDGPGHYLPRNYWPASKSDSFSPHGENLMDKGDGT